MMPITLAFTDAGYVAAGYTVTLSALGVYALWVLARGRRLAKRVPPEHRRWLS